MSSTVTDNNPAFAEINALYDCLDSGDLQQTEQRCRNLQRLYPRSEMLNNLLGITLVTAGRNSEALACYQLALKCKPGYADAHYNIGLLLKSIGRDAEAILSFKQAVDLDPEFADAMNNLGVLLQDQQLTDEALHYLSRASKLAPDSAAIHFNYGNSLRAKGLLNEALTMFKRAILLNPGFAAACNNCAAVLEKMQRLEEAYDYYSRAIQLQPEYSQAFSNRGSLLKKMSKHEGALQDFRCALEYGNWTGNLVDQNLKFRLWVNIGDILMYLRRFAEALAAYEKAHAAEPHNTDILAFKGNAIAAMGRLAEGLSLRQAAFGFIAFDSKQGIRIKHGVDQ